MSVPASPIRVWALLFKNWSDHGAPHHFHPPLAPCGWDDPTHQARWVQNRQGSATQLTEIAEKMTLGSGGEREGCVTVLPRFDQVCVTCHRAACQRWLTGRKDVLHTLWCQLLPLIIDWWHVSQTVEDCKLCEWRQCWCFLWENILLLKWNADLVGKIK